MKELNGWLRSQPADALESIRVMATATGNEDILLALTPWPGCDCHKEGIPTPPRLYCICPSYNRAKLEAEVGAANAQL